MNLTPLQIASRNLFAATSGMTDPVAVEMAMASETLVSLLELNLAPAITGPFGNLAVDESCSCQGIDGYRQALDDVEAVMKASDSVFDAVDLAHLRRELEEGPTDEPELPFDLAEVLSKALGREVRVFKLP